VVLTFANARAEGTDRLDPVVVTATRLPLPASRVAAAVTVITAEQIRDRGYRTLDEALASVPGMRAVRTGPVGAQTSVFMRGTESDHVLVLLDGVPINDPSSPGNAFDFGSDMLGGIERIEIVRGGASSLYGSNALGGVVNLISARNTEDGHRGQASAAIGTDATYTAQASVSGREGALDYALSAESFDTDGYNITPRRLAGAGDEDDGASYRSGSLGLGYALNDTTHIDGSIRYRISTIDLDDVPNGDPNSTAENAHLAWTLGGTHDVSDAVTVKARIGQSQHDRKARNTSDASSVTVQKDDLTGRRDFAEANITWDAGAIGPIDAVQIAGGGEVRRDSLDQSSSSDIGFGPFVQSANADSTDKAGFVSLTGALGTRLDMNAALRLELPDDFGSQLTYRLGGVVHVPEVSSRLSASVYTAFKAPGLFDRFGTNNFGYQGNPNLKPEDARGFELGVETDLPLPKQVGAWTVGATYFNTKIDDLIDNDPTFTTSINVEKAEIEGLELTLRGEPAAWLSVSASYTYTDARETAGNRAGQLLQRRPFHQASADATFRPIAGLRISPAVTYVGSFDDYVYNDAGVGAVGPRTGYTLIDLNIRYAVTETVDLFAKGQNLLDTDYETASGFAGQSRAGLAGVTVRF
jgi:vitamin B12 transporter